MARRGRGADDLDGDQPIELIDSEVRSSVIELGADIRPPPGGEPAASHSRVVGLAAVLLAAIAAWALATNRNEAAAPPTTEPAPVEEPEPGIETAKTGVGPELRWASIVWNIGTNDFRWINGAFVGDDGITEWSVTPSIIGPTIGQRPSVLTDRPDYFIVDAVGARVLAPRVEQPDHLLVIAGDGSETRIDLPPKPGVTELVTRHHRIEVAVIGSTAVVAVHQEDRVDGEALSARVGMPLGDVLGVRVFTDRLSILVAGAPGNPPQAIDFAFDDAPFTATERSAVAGISNRVDLYAVDLADGSIGPAGIVPDAVESLGVAGERFVLEWYTSTAPAFVSTSTTGRSWAPPRDFTGIGRIDGDAGSIYGVLLTTDIVTRSADGGSTWTRTPSPLREFELTAGRDHIVLTEKGAPQPTLTYEVEADGYLMTITEDAFNFVPDGSAFVLTELSSGSVSTGRIGAVGSGVTYDSYDGSVDVVDADGAIIASISPSAQWLARNRTLSTVDPPPSIAATRWAGGEPPEWSVDSLADLFGDTAVRVDFVGGEAEILAVVTTTNGYRLHMAELPPG